jgi:hypothetical protein
MLREPRGSASDVQIWTQRISLHQHPHPRFHLHPTLPAVQLLLTQSNKQLIPNRHGLRRCALDPVRASTQAAHEKSTAFTALPGLGAHVAH